MQMYKPRQCVFFLFLFSSLSVIYTFQMYLFSADDTVVNARKCQNLECGTVQSMVSLHSKLHIVCEQCTQRNDANFLFIVFTCGKENITRHKNLEFSRHFFSMKMLPFYICDCCHMRGKFQMPVNYLFVCLF